MRPFFALDGSNVKAGVNAAKQLIEECRTEFQNSALFLFFAGRVERLEVILNGPLGSRLSIGELTSVCFSRTLMPPSWLTTKPWMRPAKEKWDCCVYTRLPGVTWFVWVTRKLIDLWHSYSNSRGGRKVSTRIWRQVIIVSNGSLVLYFFSSSFFFRKPKRLF